MIDARAVGTVASTVNPYAVLDVPAFPARSSTTAVKLCVPLARLVVAKLQSVPMSVASPRRVDPSYTAKTSPVPRVAVMVPFNTGVLSLVVVPLAILTVVVDGTLSSAPVIAAVTVGAVLSRVNVDEAVRCCLPYRYR